MKGFAGFVLVCVLLALGALSLSAQPRPSVATPAHRWQPAPYGTPWWPTPRGVEPTRTPLPTTTATVRSHEYGETVWPTPTLWDTLGMPGTPTITPNAY